MNLILKFRYINAGASSKTNEHFRKLMLTIKQKMKPRREKRHKNGQIQDVVNSQSTLRPAKLHVKAEKMLWKWWPKANRKEKN